MQTDTQIEEPTMPENQQTIDQGKKVSSKYETGNIIRRQANSIK